MSESIHREWRFYLDDMIEFAEKVMTYTEGLDQESFVASGLNYDSTVRNLELIGEAATHIPESIRKAHPHIPWRLHCNPQSFDSWLSWHRQRHALEHH